MKFGFLHTKRGVRLGLILLLLFILMGGGVLSAQSDTPPDDTPRRFDGPAASALPPSLTLLSPQPTDTLTDPANITFSWTALSGAKWYRLRIVQLRANRTPKVVFTQKFNAIALLCANDTCTVDLASLGIKLKAGKRYKWQIMAKIPGQKVLVQTPRWRFRVTSVLSSVQQVNPPRTIAYTSFSLPGSGQVHVKDVSGANVTNFPQSGTIPIWSLTGGELGYVTTSAQIAVYDFRTQTGSTLGGNPNAVIPQVKDTYWDPVWSPDGTKIALTASTGGNDFDIYIVNAANGSLEVTVTDDAFPDGAPFWSVDGTRLGFISLQPGLCSLLCRGC